MEGTSTEGLPTVVVLLGSAGIAARSIVAGGEAIA
jgi:hypothetical protein